MALLGRVIGSYQMWMIRVLVLAVVLCGGVPWGAVCAPAANPIDAAAMQAIAKSIGWGVKSSDPCTWAGVSCNQVGRITSIVASHAGLRGYLDGGDLSKLTFLSNLDLSFNGLSGSLPVLPKPLQFLRTIDLGSNSFNRLPDGFYAGLPALETIVLDNNRLRFAWSEQSDIPSSRLRSFSANNVSMYAGFPNFFGNATSFPALERLSLARNQIWGTVHTGFGANSKIRYLDIGGQTGNAGDRMNGRLDVFIAGMLNLVEAHLDHYGFSGPLPDATKLVNLRVFDASYNDLCGAPKFPTGTTVDLTGNPRVGRGC